MITNEHNATIHTFNNLTLCKVNYFETCWCKLNSNESLICPYLLRYVKSLSNTDYFCTYHVIRKTIECFNSTIVYPKKNAISSIYITLTLVLFLIGLFGNGLSIIILFHKKLRRSSIYQNLTLLCSLNIFYLLTILIRHQNPYRKDLRDISQNLCRIHTFLVALTGHLCSWQLVSTSIQRVFALLSLKLQRANSWKQTISIFIICVLLPLIIFDGQLLFNYGIFTNRHMCDENISYESKQFQRALVFPLTITKNISVRYYSRFSQTEKTQRYSCPICILWNILDTLIYTILPFCILLISSIIIIISICKRRRSTINLGGKCHNNQDKSSILLIIINCIFLILTGPLEICLICQSLMKIFSPKIFFILNQLLRLLQNSYHALSFLFYCINGNKFRQTAMKSFRRLISFGFGDQSNQSAMNIYFRRQTISTTSSQDLTKRTNTNSGKKKRTYLTITASDIEMKPVKTCR